MAIASEDAIVLAFFGQKIRRPPKRFHEVARMSARAEDMIADVHLLELCNAFEGAKQIILKDDQGLEGLIKSTSDFIDLRKWANKTVGTAHGMVPALKWYILVDHPMLANTT
jgi:hypothetical protein